MAETRQQYNARMRDNGGMLYDNMSDFTVGGKYGNHAVTTPSRQFTTGNNMFAGQDSTYGQSYSNGYSQPGGSNGMNWNQIAAVGGTAAALGGSLSNIIRGLRPAQVVKGSTYYNPYEKEVMGMYEGITGMYNGADPAQQYLNKASSDVDSTGSLMLSDLNKSANDSRSYSTKQIDTLKNRTYNVNPMLQQAELASRIGAEDAKQYSSSGSEYMNRRQAIQADRLRNVSQIYNQKANVENQYATDVASAYGNRASLEDALGARKTAANSNLLGMRSTISGQKAQSAREWLNARAQARSQQAAARQGFGNQRAQADLYADQATAANEAARRNMMAQGIGGLSQAGSNFAMMGMNGGFSGMFM